MNQHSQIPADVDAEPRDEPVGPGSDPNEWRDYQLDADDRVPEETGYGHGV